MRQFLLLFALAVIFAACSTSTKKNSGMQTGETDTIAQPVNISVNEFLEKADDLVGKEITIQGTVSHTCKHGGKRMFIFDDNEDNRVKIEASETVTSFDASLEGSDVLVTGLLKELVIDENYLTEWELEVKNEMENPEPESDSVAAEHSSGGLGESADQGEHVSAMESIENYRQQIKESGSDHLSFYSVECTAYEILAADTIQ
jgi:hypothetical protein